jgi:prophage regulatory protein
MTDPTSTDALQLVPAAPIVLVGVSEIHDLLLRISRERVEGLTYRDDFPEPAAELHGGVVWLREEVEAWIDEHGDALAQMLRPGR